MFFKIVYLNIQHIILNIKSLLIGDFLQNKLHFSTIFYKHGSIFC